MLTASAVSMSATLVPLPAILSKCGPMPFARTTGTRLRVAGTVFVIAAVVFLIVILINQSLGGPLF